MGGASLKEFFRRPFSVEGQIEIFEYSLRPVIDPFIKHPRPLAFQIHRHEVPFDKIQKIKFRASRLSISFMSRPLQTAEFIPCFVAIKD